MMAGRIGPARTGRRNTALLEPPAPVDETVEAEILYVCGPRPMRFADLELTEGVEVPGAGDWPRIDAWVSARRVRKVTRNDPHTLFADFVGMTYEDYLAQLEVASLEAEAAAEEPEAEPATEEPETSEE